MDDIDPKQCYGFAGVDQLDSVVVRKALASGIEGVLSFFEGLQRGGVPYQPIPTGGHVVHNHLEMVYVAGELGIASVPGYLNDVFCDEDFAEPLLPLADLERTTPDERIQHDIDQAAPGVIDAIEKILF